MPPRFSSPLRALFFILLFSFSLTLRASDPTPRDLDAAIATADFSTYFANLSTYIAQKNPADPSKISPLTLEPLFKSPPFASALAQRQFIAKVSPQKLAAFTKADPANPPFLNWLLKNPLALDLFLLTATPLSIPAREDNSYSISTTTLDHWKKIFTADPDSKSGVPLRLAIATSLRPPGTGSPGSGQQKIPTPPLIRYQYFKTAHAKKELFPSFDTLTPWELQFVVCSGASEADLTWGRAMVNTWRPDLRTEEKVVDSTSLVWRRNSPISHVDYKTVLDGGGKCGPRSSWSVFICQSFGIPAIGVGQPAHACVAYKSLHGWQVAYGKGWDASRLEGMGGREFLASVASRERPENFALTEHLRWFASSLPSKDSAATLLTLARSLTKSEPIADKILQSSQNADESDADPVAKPLAKSPLPPTTQPLPLKLPPPNLPPGSIHLEGTDFTETGGITVWGGEPRVTILDSFNGGKQLHFQQGMASCWVGYKINVPETGLYRIIAKVATVNSGQNLYFRSFGAMAPVKNATASAVWKGMTKDLGPQMAVDDNPSTRWAVNFGVDKAWIELDLGRPTTISTVMIDERAYEKVAKFLLEYKVGSEWKTILEGTTIGNSYAKDFPPVTTQFVRLSTTDCSGNTGGPTFWEFNVGSVQDGHVWMNLPWTAGLWENTKPSEIRLVKGPRMLWVFAPYQRGVALKSLDLQLKSPNSPLLLPPRS